MGCEAAGGGRSWMLWSRYAVDHCDRGWGDRSRPLMRVLRRAAALANQLRRSDPAGVADDAAHRLRRALQPGRATLEERFKALAAMRAKACEVGAPLAHRGLADLVPAQAVPVTKIRLGQGGFDVMPPAPTGEPAAHVGTASQGRCMDHARQAMRSCMAAQSVREPLGLARVDRQIGATDAAARSANGFRVSPHVQHGRGGHLHVVDWIIHGSPRPTPPPTPAGSAAR